MPTFLSKILSRFLADRDGVVALVFFLVSGTFGWMAVRPRAAVAVVFLAHTISNSKMVEAGATAPWDDAGSVGARERMPRRQGDGM